MKLGVQNVKNVRALLHERQFPYFNCSARFIFASIHDILSCIEVIRLTYSRESVTEGIDHILYVPCKL